MTRALLSLVLAAWLALGACHAQAQTQPQATDIGPARFFSRADMLDESTLDTLIRSDQLRASAVRPGQQVRVIELEFTSQHWHGLTWKHPARVYVPESHAGGGNAGIIGTERGFFDNPRSPRRRIPGTDLDTEAEYAEATAIDLKLPIMIFANPAEDYWGLHESDQSGYALKKMLQTGDLTWNGYHPIAMAYLRAITLMHALPGVGTERAVLTGCSKRGQAVAITTGVDPERVAGIMATCHFGGNTLYFVAKKFAEFGATVGGPDEARSGPGYQPPEQVLKAINNPVGLQMLQHYDPYFWRDRIAAKFLVAVGTNDEFYALGTPNSMMSDMKGDKAFLAIDNVRHSWVSAKHLAAWRMWLAHTFLGRPVPQVQVSARIEGDALAVRASASGAASPVKLRLFHAYNAVGKDWRRATWQAVDMTATTDGYSAQLPRRAGQKLAWYVEVQDSGVGGPGYVSSLVEVSD